MEEDWDEFEETPVTLYEVAWWSAIAGIVMIIIGLVWHFW